ncbi:MAG: hypothetical protein E7605_05175 [Ruminococcaceae bacterium]|nr:hypothetical protein [Oscillospiraceae bacterium]
MKVVYYPYHSHSIAAAMIGIPSAAGFCIFCGLCLSQNAFWGALVCFSMALVMFFLNKYFYDSAKIVVLLTFEKIEIINQKKQPYFFIEWQEISFTYYTRNYKGHGFWVISAEPLSSNQCRKAIRHSFQTLTHGNIIVIPDNMTQDTAHIKAIIAENTTYTE